MPWIILGIAAVIVIYFISAYNGFVSLKNRVDEAFATMDVYMKKRYDLIPNLVATVKGYATHERETLENVVKARNIALSSQNIEDQSKAEGDLNRALGRLMMLTENYPDLKANQQFLDLQRDLGKLETEIAQSRKFYNAVVRQLNTKCETFPSVLIAKLFGFKPAAYFEVTDESQREAVRVEF